MKTKARQKEQKGHSVFKISPQVTLPKEEAEWLPEDAFDPLLQPSPLHLDIGEPQNPLSNPGNPLPHPFSVLAAEGCQHLAFCHTTKYQTGQSQCQR
jgi:hypothetical protein